MSKELVEVTTKVPKSLMKLLEAENYLGWDRKVFFESAIRALICISLGHMTLEDEKRIHEKYGRDVGVIYLPESLKD